MTETRATREAEPHWLQLARRDPRGEAYLMGRSLLPESLDPDVCRFSIGASGDRWLDARATEGFRLAFAVRAPSGVVQSISLRHVGPGDPPPSFPPKLALPGCSTSRAGIVRPGFIELATDDPEFRSDEVEIVEGGADWLAAQLEADLAFVEGLRPPRWTLAAIGASNAAGVVEAFAATIRGRRFFIRLDGDEVGEKAVPAVAEAAHRIGALEVLRTRPASKDVAADWQGAA